MDGELNDCRDQIAALDVEVAKLTNKCQVIFFIFNNGNNHKYFIIETLKLIYEGCL